MLKKIFIIQIIFFGSYAYGQFGVGINTSNPEATLHIKLNDKVNYGNAISIRSEDNTLKFRLDSLGMFRFGDLESAIPIDGRLNSNSSIIKIGNTTLNAELAQEGALRYNTDSEILECSNGEQWLVLNYDTPPDHLIAVNNFNRVDLKNNDYTILTNWKEQYDSRNSFDSISGTYRVPTTGMYILSFSVFTNINNQTQDSYFKGEWVKVEGSTYTPIVQSKNNYTSKGSYMLGISCTGTVRLNQDDIIAARVIHNSGDGRMLRVDLSPNHTSVSDRNFNSLSIIRILE